MLVATPELLDIIVRDSQYRAVHAATGAVAPSPDVRRWRAWWMDAVVVIERERVAEHNARLKADMGDGHH